MDLSKPIPSITLDPITREQLKEYAKASGDYNPVHLEDAIAAKAGFPSVIVHGMLSMALLGDGVRRHFPETDYQLLRIATRFRKVTFPGDRLTWQGEIKNLTSDSEFTLHIALVNQNQEVTAEGQVVLSRI